MATAQPTIIKTPGVGAQPYPAPPAAPTGGLFNWAKSQVPGAPATGPGRGLFSWATRQADANKPQVNNGAPDPGPGSATQSPPAAATTAPFSSAYGSESGPGILEQRFNNRLNGTDPAYDYAVKRGSTALDNRYGAAGDASSGAAMQAHGDLIANLTAQSQAQIDALAGGASGEHQGKVNSMFNQGLGIAGGQAGTAGAYDLGAGNAMSAANSAALMLALQKAGVDSQAAQGFINNLMGGVALANGIGGTKKP